jgi:hypothetical protein
LRTQIATDCDKRRRTEYAKNSKLGDAALLRAPLFGFAVGRFFRLGEEVDLFGDDLATIAVGAVLLGLFGIVDATGYHDHRPLGDMLCDAFADAVEAGDAAPFRL